MLPDRVSNPGPLTYKSGALPIALRGPAESNAYLKQIKVILSAVKKYRIFSLVTNTIYIFSL